MTNLEKAFKGAAWMECTLRKAMEQGGLKLKHSDRCGPVMCLLTSANRQRQSPFKQKEEAKSALACAQFSVHRQDRLLPWGQLNLHVETGFYSTSRLVTSTERESRSIPDRPLEVLLPLGLGGLLLGLLLGPERKVANEHPGAGPTLHVDF